MAKPEVGSEAPNFSLLNQNGETVTLKDFRGKSNIVLYFYPKASTPGCTVQACGIRDFKSEFKKLDTVVFGISPDPLSKLKKFDEKYELDFALLSDEDHQIADAYGVWGLKKFMGKEFMGIIRTTFIIDKLGHVRHIIDKVNTKTHNEDVATYIKGNI
jgi:thioredoxin-dependent peroxiredoxin